MSQTASNPHHTHPYPRPYSTPSMVDTHVQSMQYPSYPPGPPQPPPHQQQQQQQAPAPPPQPMQFYPPYAIAPPTDPNAPIRYAIPPNPDGRLGPGRGHKKEIKRRTKTGCLTCRKRRIKCDEGHPTCRNCQKSKRECLGYDPIFKPQPGPPVIQPASQQYAAMSRPSAPSFTLASYGCPMVQNSLGASDAADTVDPILDGAIDENTGEDAEAAQESDQPSRKRKRIKIEEVLCMGGAHPPPPAPSTPISEEMKGEIQKIYKMAYAPGMDKFFETRWFSERGLDHVMDNPTLCDQFALLTNRFSLSPQDPDYSTQLQITHSLEAVVVWSMLVLCQKVAQTTDEDGNVNDKDVESGVLDAAKRLEIFEALITGVYVPSELAPPQVESKSNGTALQGQLKSRENEFWHLAHRFLSYEDGSTESAQAITSILASCRNLLERRENRDVIYSILIARYYGPKVPGFPHHMKQPDTNSEEDLNAKVGVAVNLLQGEAAGKGTNQVVQRLCGAAVRSWDL